MMMMMMIMMMVMKLYIHVVVNLQLFKQHIRRLVKYDHIAGSCVDPSMWPVFFFFFEVIR